MIKFKRVISILFVGLFFQLTCVAQEKSLALDEYIIKPEDSLLVTVWKHDDLNQKVKVDTDGNINFPLIGKVKAVGLTISQLRDRITELLGKDYIINPLVTVDIEKYIERQVFFVYGEAKNPGAHTLEGQMTLLRAITLAGGLSDFASSVVYIKRKVNNKEQRIKVNINRIISQETADIPLKPDDIIVVPRRFF
ncbi:MAG: polysaccharide biosynthesis/export family protein [Candidatus Omnitrophota bacterium]|nr:polysaccharide biosynthesis/export family protein [Candidatus Omnitrophota bacterium]